MMVVTMMKTMTGVKMTATTTLALDAFRDWRGCQKLVFS